MDIVSHAGDRAQSTVIMMRWLAFFLRHGADPNIARPVISCLAPGISQEHSLKSLQRLIEHGADLNRTFDLHGDSNSQFNVLDWAKDSKVIGFLRSHEEKHANELSSTELSPFGNGSRWKLKVSN